MLLCNERQTAEPKQCLFLSLSRYLCKAHTYMYICISTPAIRRYAIYFSSNKTLNICQKNCRISKTCRAEDYNDLQVTDAQRRQSFFLWNLHLVNRVLHSLFFLLLDRLPMLSVCERCESHTWTQICHISIWMHPSNIKPLVLDGVPVGPGSVGHKARVHPGWNENTRTVTAETPISPTACLWTAVRKCRAQRKHTHTQNNNMHTVHRKSAVRLRALSPGRSEAGVNRSLSCPL